MTIVPFNGGDAVTMSSSEISDLTGKLHKHIIRDIREMLAELEKDGPVLDHVREDKDSRGYTENFHLDRELTETLITGYSIPLRHKVIRRLHELEAQAARPMTQAEMIAASANILVSIERQQAQHQVSLDRVERRVEDLSQSTVWDHCPQNCQSLTRIKESMLARHGLSGVVVDYILKAWPNQPNPAGMVRNGHENASGSQYLVWSKSHVTAAFKRFVSECQMLSTTQATHPYFEGRFRLVPKAKS
jgi:phage regulator Rha-like protein